jgi:hypothetical protein
MQVKRRNIPTIEGVTRQMQVFELRYRITTDEFLRAGSSGCSVTEDDAMEWRYLREQLTALQEAAIEQVYSASPTGPTARLRNCENTSELLAA